ncbi:hypothetical protein HQ560_17535, partial [bacterium]|nr:hypothetical protein [bacterium]
MNRTLLTSLLVCLLGAAVAGEAPKPAVDPLEALCQKLQKNPGGATEAEARTLLEMARKLGRPTPVAIALKSYLAQHFNPSPALAAMAAENALHVGDYRTAISRFKTSLKNSRGGGAAGDVAATLYMTLVDFLVADDDAYRYMDQHGARLRGSVAARKFDRWLLDAARRRRGYAAMAQRLVGILGDRMPIEQERLYCWDHLDWLIGESASGNGAQHEAIVHYKRLVPLIRDSRERTLRLAFHVARLAFEANAAGKDRATLDGDYKAVAKAARAYFDAFPTANVLKDVVCILGGNKDRFDDGHWRKQEAQNREIFIAAFSKLDDAGREAVLAWRDRNLRTSGLASSTQWVDLGTKHAALFRRSAGVRHMPFAFRTEDRALLKKQTAFLTGVQGIYAATINGLAASDDFAKCLQHVGAKETWHLGFRDYQQVVHVHMWTVFKRLGYVETKKEPGGDVLGRAVAQFGAEHLAKSPVVLFDLAAARAYIDAVWHYGGKDGFDKSKVAPALRSLDWAPYTAQERRTVFQPTYDYFRRWAGDVRKAAKAGKNAEAVKQIAALDAEFQRSLKAETGDPNKAPNDLCKKLAQAVVAIRDKKKDDFVKIAKALLPTVRDYARKKTPFGAATYAFLLGNHAEAFDTVDLQCQALAETLKSYDPNKPNAAAFRVLALIGERRPGWSNGWTDKKGREAALKVNVVIEKA